MTNKAPQFAFFGTPQLAAVFLDDLESAGLVPALVISSPDAPQGRGMMLTPPPVKAWARARDIPVLQPEAFDEYTIESIRSYGCEFGIVIYYGKILPKAILDIFPRGILNVHFSLLPKWRGTAPVRSAILNDDRETGISIILLDEKMDHGPIIMQKKIAVADWPPRASALEELSTHESARLLIEILPRYLAGEITPQEQDHTVTTVCPKLTKEDGRIDLHADGYANLLKIRGLDTSIGTYALFERNGTAVRVKILDAHLEGSNLVLDRVVPEGKKEMAYQEFARSGATLLQF